MKAKVDLSKYENVITRKEQFLRLVWMLCWLVMVRPFPRSFANPWKVILLNLFGAQVHKKATIYSSVKIYMPWNLKMGPYSCLGPEVDCYNVAPISIGEHTTISQKTYLCAASHDVTNSQLPLLKKTIQIQNQVWVGASCFIGGDVILNQGVVVGATASVYKSVPAWTIVGGNPAKFLKNRVVNE